MHQRKGAAKCQQGRLQKKNPTTQLRHCLIILDMQCEQTIFTGFNQSPAVPSDLPATVSELAQGNSCRIVGADQQDNSPLPTLAKS